MKVEIRPNGNGESIITLEETRFFFCGDIYTVPKGFASDGASVPRFLWRLLSPKIDPVTLTPSVVHDYLYAFAIGTRAEADYWYCGALVDNGYPPWKAFLTLIGVRLFGGRHYGD